MSINLQAITVLITHAGVFHADDVFTTAWLRLLGVTAPVQHVNQVPTGISNALVYDVGNGEYDHHRDNKLVRSNGVPYAAFGLVFRDTWSLVFTEDEAKGFDKAFIQGLDASDNGYVPKGEIRRVNPLATVISAFNPNWNEDADVNDQFEAAVEMAKTILDREIRRIQSTSAAREIADKAIASKQRIVFFDHYAPIAFALRDSIVEWMGYPSIRGGYALCSILDSQKQNKALIPVQLRGKPANELPSGMTFCHSSGFLASFDSADSARSFAKQWL